MALRAYAYASGLIVFAEKQPEGTLPIPDVGREKIEARARRAYDGSFVVPGVGELDGDEAVDAFSAWCDWLSGAKKCAVCGCTERSACIDRDGDACWWVHDRLCSVCAEYCDDADVIEVAYERRRQDVKWGGPDNDDANTIGDWLRHIGSHLCEGQSAHAAGNPEEFRRVMTQVAALAVASHQSFTRQQAQASEEEDA